MGPKKRPRSTEKSSDNPDDPESSNLCKGCNKVFKSVRTHLLRSKTNCIKQYTDSEHETLEKESQAKKRRTDAENNAEHYQKNKEKIAEKKAERYQKNKEKIAQRYQENKEKIAQRYQENKEKIAQQYQIKKSGKTGQTKIYGQNQKF